MRTKITQEIVQKLFIYDPETGDLSWKRAPFTNSKKGAPAKTKSNGYYVVSVYGKIYGVHRIIWLYVYGYLPENDIDHIDRDKLNNKINNLREVSRQCNQRNVGLCIKNKSGVTGVHFNRLHFSWTASIRVNNKHYYLGSYIDFIEAVCMRLAAEQCLDWPNCNSNSTAYQLVKSWLANLECLEELYA